MQCELVCTTPIKHSPCLNSHPSPRCDSPARRRHPARRRRMGSAGGKIKHQFPIKLLLKEAGRGGGQHIANVWQLQANGSKRGPGHKAQLCLPSPKGWERFEVAGCEMHPAGALCLQSVCSAPGGGVRLSPGGFPAGIAPSAASGGVFALWLSSPAAQMGCEEIPAPGWLSSSTCPPPAAKIRAERCHGGHKAGSSFLPPAGRALLCPQPHMGGHLGTKQSSGRGFSLSRSSQLHGHGLA